MITTDDDRCADLASCNEVVEAKPALSRSPCEAGRCALAGLGLILSRAPSSHLCSRSLSGKSSASRPGR